MTKEQYYYQKWNRFKFGEISEAEWREFCRLLFVHLQSLATIPARISKREIRFRNIPIIPYAIGLHVSNADAIGLHVDISGFSDMGPAPRS